MINFFLLDFRSLSKEKSTRFRHNGVISRRT